MAINIVVPCGHSRGPPVTRKRLPSLALVKDFPETNAGELPEVGGCGDCWNPWWVASDARDMMENALSILIVIFLQNCNKPRPQKESCLFSDLASLINVESAKFV